MSNIKSIRFLALSGVTALCGVHQVHAATIVQQESFAFSLSPGGTTIGFDQFDDQGGTLVLNQVTLAVDAQIGASITLENLSKTTLQNPAVTANGQLDVDFNFLDFNIGYADTFTCESGALAPFDGVYGVGKDFCDFGAVSAAGNQSVSASSGLTPFIGNGTVDANIFASGAFLFNAPVDFFLQVLDFGAEGTVTVIYDFDSVVIPLPPALGLGLAGLGAISLRRRRWSA